MVLAGQGYLRLFSGFFHVKERENHETKSKMPLIAGIFIAYLSKIRCFFDRLAEYLPKHPVCV